MVFVDSLNDPNRSDYELQEFWLFCITAPTHNLNQLHSHAEKIHDFLLLIGANETNLPLTILSNLRLTTILLYLRMAKIKFPKRATLAIIRSYELTTLHLINYEVDSLCEYLGGFYSFQIRLFIKNTRYNSKNILINKAHLEILKIKGYWVPKRIKTENEYRDLELILQSLKFK